MEWWEQLIENNPGLDPNLVQFIQRHGQEGGAEMSIQELASAYTAESLLGGPPPEENPEAQAVTEGPGQEPIPGQQSVPGTPGSPEAEEDEGSILEQFGIVGMEAEAGRVAAFREAVDYYPQYLTAQSQANEGVKQQADEHMRELMERAGMDFDDSEDQGRLFQAAGQARAESQAEEDFQSDFQQVAPVLVEMGMPPDYLPSVQELAAWADEYQSEFGSRDPDDWGGLSAEEKARQFLVMIPRAELNPDLNNFLQSKMRENDWQVPLVEEDGVEQPRVDAIEALGYNREFAKRTIKMTERYDLDEAVVIALWEREKEDRPSIEDRSIRGIERNVEPPPKEDERDPRDPRSVFDDARPGPSPGADPADGRQPRSLKEIAEQFSTLQGRYEGSALLAAVALEDKDLADRLYNDPYSLSGDELRRVDEIRRAVNEDLPSGGDIAFSNEASWLDNRRAGVPIADTPTVDRAGIREAARTIAQAWNLGNIGDEVADQLADEILAKDVARLKNNLPNPFKTVEQTEPPVEGEIGLSESDVAARLRQTDEYQRLFAHKDQAETEDEYVGRFDRQAESLLGNTDTTAIEQRAMEAGDVGVVGQQAFATGKGFESSNYQERIQRMAQILREMT